MMKLPFAFSLKLVFRLLLPGFVISLGLFPVLQVCLDALRVEFVAIGAFLLCVVVTGWLFIVLDMPIYMLFEGRRYWPDVIRRYFLKREEKRKGRLLAAFNSGDVRRKREISVELRSFPIDEDTGDFEAWFPTRLGNLLSSYEEYPQRVYGMDAVFYWYRLWLKLDKDQREEIDHQQAIVDSSIYVTAALCCVGILSISYSAIKASENRLVGTLKEIEALNEFLPGAESLLAIGAMCLVLAFLLYRASLNLHRQFGETFKSVFDSSFGLLDVDPIIDTVGRITGDRALSGLTFREKYKIAWRYLHNNRIMTDKGSVPVPKLIASKGKVDETKLKPARGRVLAKEITSRECSATGKRFLEAEVAAVGDGGLDSEGRPVALEVVVGDRILVGDSAVERVKIIDDELLALKDADVIVITRPQASGLR